jgi:hypothetical protein
MYTLCVQLALSGLADADAPVVVEEVIYPPLRLFYTKVEGQGP